MGASAWEPGTWIGLGILFYGIVYTLIHDGLVHQRYFRWVPKRGYAKRLVQSHKLHHATIGKEGGVSFGFVIARDPAVLKQELKVAARRGNRCGARCAELSERGQRRVQLRPEWRAPTPLPCHPFGQA
jgi:beta-carotene 3-hydroxylase